MLKFKLQNTLINFQITEGLHYAISHVFNAFNCRSFHYSQTGFFRHAKIKKTERGRLT